MQNRLMGNILESLYDFFCEAFIDDKELYPTFVFIKDGESEFTSGNFKNQVEKDIQIKSIIKKAEIEQPDFIAHASEAWAVSRDADTYDANNAPLPSEEPDRKEIVMVFIQNPEGESMSIAAEIIRDGDNVTLGKAQHSGVQPTMGDMSFFPQVVH